jgi:hypothetical protein
MQWLIDHATHDRDECLIWPFAVHHDGRGQVSIGMRTLQAHRVMCKLAHGDAPTERHEAAHSCGNGHLGCVNPRHLRWATSKENKADQLAHGTRVWGEKHPSHKLTRRAVRTIRSLADIKPREALAQEFGVHVLTIGKVIRRESWRHI